MQIPIERLLNLPDIRVLNVEITEREIKCEIRSTRDDQERPVALAVLEDRKKETVAAVMKSIPKDLRATVEEVCAGLNERFIKAAEEALPRAKVVGDRFHAAKLYRAAFDDIRKKEMEELKRILDKQE